MKSLKAPCQRIDNLGEPLPLQEALCMCNILRTLVAMHSSIFISLGILVGISVVGVWNHEKDANTNRRENHREITTMIKPGINASWSSIEMANPPARTYSEVSRLSTILWSTMSLSHATFWYLQSPYHGHAILESFRQPSTAKGTGYNITRFSLTTSSK